MDECIDTILSIAILLTSTVQTLRLDELALTIGHHCEKCNSCQSELLWWRRHLALMQLPSFSEFMPVFVDEAREEFREDHVEFSRRLKELYEGSLSVEFTVCLRIVSMMGDALTGPDQTIEEYDRINTIICEHTAQCPTCLLEARAWVIYVYAHEKVSIRAFLEADRRKIRRDHVLFNEALHTQYLLRQVRDEGVEPS